jgi:hypothetical protein
LAPRKIKNFEKVVKVQSSLDKIKIHRNKTANGKEV